MPRPNVGRCANCFWRWGPGHPTLCEGWTAVDLAAHLVVRERRPSAGPGIVFAGRSRYTQRAMNRAIDRNGFEALVERVSSGPPRLLRSVDGPMNLIEYFIHHEDLRRGAEAVSQRADLEALDDALWAQPPRRFKMMTRKLRDVDLILRDPGRGDLHIGGGDRSAIIAGPASEIVLYLFGRRARHTSNSTETSPPSLSWAPERSEYRSPGDRPDRADPVLVEQPIGGCHGRDGPRLALAGPDVVLDSARRSPGARGLLAEPAPRIFGDPPVLTDETVSEAGTAIPCAVRGYMHERGKISRTRFDSVR